MSDTTSVVREQLLALHLVIRSFGATRGSDFVSYSRGVARRHAVCEGMKLGYA